MHEQTSSPSLPDSSAIPRSGYRRRLARLWLRRWKRHSYVFTLSFMYLLLLVVAIAAKTLRISYGGMPLIAIADFFRSEIFLVAAVFLMSAGALLNTRSASLKAGIFFVATILWVIIGLTEVLGTGYLLATGDEGFSFPFFVWAVKKLKHIAPMFSAEQSKAAVPLLAAAGLLLPIFFAAVYLQRSHRRFPTRSRRNNPRLGRWLMTVAPLAFVLSVLPSYYTDDVFASRAFTINAGLDALALAARDDRTPPPIRAGYALNSTLVPLNAGAGKTNLVIILLESTRASATSVYNPTLETTPTLKKLAASSVVAERAYAFVPQTSKSLVATLCGVESFLRRGVREALESRGIPAKCLARLVDEVGYDTAYFQSATRTFEHRGGLITNFGYKYFRSGDDIDKSGFETANYFGVEDNVMLEPSREWLAARAGKPFFVTYLTNTPHHPYLAPKRYGIKPYSGNELFNRYLNSVNYVDHFIDSLMRQYKELGLYRNTVFIIMGDHGEGFGEHGMWSHITTIYDEGLHIPLLIHDGRAPKAGRITVPVSALDVMPTALRMLGYRIEGGEYPGTVMSERAPEAPVWSYCWRERQCMSMTVGHFKLIHHFDHRPDELFDLLADPGETDDLKRKLPGRAAVMRGRLLTWWRGVNSWYARYYHARKTDPDARSAATAASAASH